MSLAFLAFPPKEPMIISCYNLPRGIYLTFLQPTMATSSTVIPGSWQIFRPLGPLDIPGIPKQKRGWDHTPRNLSESPQVTFKENESTED